MNEARLLKEGLRVLRDRLPPGWNQEAVFGGVRAPDQPDVVLRITGPDGVKARVLVEAKNRVFPRDVAQLKTRFGRDSAGPNLVVTGFLTPITRRRLQEEGLNYLDVTGNLRLILSRPGLYLETAGASEDPSPGEASARSLRGPRAGRLVRALCDFPLPLTISGVASKAGVDVSYASRLVELLARDGVLTRVPRGPVEAVNRAGIIRRWAEDYSVLKSNNARSFLDPRGLDNLVRRLPESRFRYAVTGSLAANRLAPIAPARLAMVYVEDDEMAADTLGLRPADAGPNVMLLTPFDSVVFDRTSSDKGTTFVAPSQAAVDLLTSPGRGPAEAEAILEWIARQQA
jgi:hypothetical protein